MIRAAWLATGIVAATTLTGCGGGVPEPPSDPFKVASWPLVEVDPVVEAVAPAPVRVLSPARARRIARRAALGVRFPKCDGVPAGSAFALDAQTLIANRDLVPGAGSSRVATRKGRTISAGAAAAYSLGGLGVVRVERRVPQLLRRAPSIALGSSVVVVGNTESGKLRMLPGVLVDSVPGAPFGVRARVLRLTTVVRDGDAGGPVLDAKGRLVAVLFATDPRTSLALAIPVPTLRALVAARKLEKLPPCGED